MIKWQKEFDEEEYRSYVKDERGDPEKKDNWELLNCNIFNGKESWLFQFYHFNNKDLYFDRFGRRCYNDEITLLIRIEQDRVANFEIDNVRGDCGIEKDSGVYGTEDFSEFITPSMRHLLETIMKIKEQGLHDLQSIEDYELKAFIRAVYHKDLLENELDVKIDPSDKKKKKKKM